MTSNINNTDPTGWTPELVREYVSGAARLEMWTIPLYLCVAFSIKNPDNPAVPISLPQALQAIAEANLTGLENSQAIRDRLALPKMFRQHFGQQAILTLGAKGYSAHKVAFRLIVLFNRCIILHRLPIYSRVESCCQ